MDITQLVLVFLGLVLGAIAGYLVLLRAEIKKNQPVVDEVLRDIAPILVRAAEKLYKSGEGSQKLGYALKRADDYLQRLGLKVDPEIIRTYIEAAVFDLGAQKS